jgi:hypothetical protein
MVLLSADDAEWSAAVDANIIAHFAAVVAASAHRSG